MDIWRLCLFDESWFLLVTNMVVAGKLINHGEFKDARTLQVGICKSEFEQIAKSNDRKFPDS